MLAWKDVLATVGSALGSSAGDCVLEFLKILPEEVTEGRKINLSVCGAAIDLGKANTEQEDELIDRTKELLEDNAEQVMQLLIQYAQSSRTTTSQNIQACLTLSSFRRNQSPSLGLYHLMASRDPRRQNRRFATHGCYFEGIG